MDLTGGAPCVDGENATSSSIIFLCDHKATDITGGPAVFRTGDDCKRSFIWHTKLACPPHTVVDCSYTTPDGYKYDLSSLSQSNMNHVEWKDNKKYVLNVCRSVVHSKIARCAYDAAACMIDNTGETSSVSLGVVGSGPTVDDNDRLMIHYANGDVCETDKSRKYKTEIVFECDPKDYFPYPSLIAQENCTFYFEWKTSAACRQKVEKVTTFGNCSARDIYKDHTFDLTALSRTEPYEIKSAGVSMLLNVCGPVSESKCPGHNGACVMRDGEEGYSSAGSASAELLAMPGALALRYDNGTKCSNGVMAITIISFFCGSEKSPEGPVLVYDDQESCTYFVNWHTELACERRIPCTANGGSNSFFDLSPLIKHRSNYEVSIDSLANSSSGNTTATKMYVNVCRPLNHIQGVNCPAGTSVCMQLRNGSVVGAGKALVPPIHTGDQSVTVMYSLGDMCASSPGLKYSSKINFECDYKAGPGQPEFSQVTSDCHVILTWKTSLVCPRPPLPEDACTVRHTAARVNLALTPLKRQGGYPVVYRARRFKVNVCGAVCSGSGVCSEEGDGTDWGQLQQSQFEWRGKRLVLTYFGGDVCYGSLTQKRTSEISFECDHNAGIGYPKPAPIMGLGLLTCKAAFTWRTNVTCPDPKAPFIPTLPPATTNTTEPSEPVKPATTTQAPKATTPAEEKTNSSSATHNGEASKSSSSSSSQDSSHWLLTTLLLLTGVGLAAGGMYLLYRAGHLQRLWRRLRSASKGAYSSRPNVFLLDDAL